MTKKERPGGAYLKYSGLAFQMFFYLLLGWFGGSWLDRKLGFEDPWMALGLTFLFLIGFFVKLYYDLERNEL